VVKPEEAVIVNALVRQYMGSRPMIRFAILLWESSRGLFSGLRVRKQTWRKSLARPQARKPVNSKLNSVKTNLACMRVGLEQPRFLPRRRGCVWTNIPDYGKIPSLELKEKRNE
jgi:hypothetical protein